ncbi:hypothetical protein OFC87_41825, partial [Escherichia coli]|nr:hypothetical protein [Escherichia coli]
MNAFRMPGQATAGFFLQKHFKGTHHRGIRALLYLQGVRVLVAGGHESVLQVYDLLTGDGAPSYRMAGHHAGIVALAS